MAQLRVDFGNLLVERDSLQSENKTLYDHKQKVVNERGTMLRQHIETVRGLERTIDEKNESFSRTSELLVRVEQAMRSYERECGKWRQRYAKLKSRRYGVVQES